MVNLGKSTLWTHAMIGLRSSALAFGVCFLTGAAYSNSVFANCSSYLEHRAEMESSSPAQLRGREGKVSSAPLDARCVARPFSIGETIRLTNEAIFGFATRSQFEVLEAFKLRCPKATRTAGGSPAQSGKSGCPMKSLARSLARLSYFLVIPVRKQELAWWQSASHPVFKYSPPEDPEGRAARILQVLDSIARDDAYLALSETQFSGLSSELAGFGRPVAFVLESRQGEN